MPEEELLRQATAKLEKPIRIIAFCNAFLDLIGLAETELYDPDQQPILDDLFDNCVRYLDLADSLHPDLLKKKDLENEIHSILFIITDGRLRLVP